MLCDGHKCIEECAMMQEEEWEVLKPSIYPDVCISNIAGPSGRMIKLEIPVELSPARSVIIVSSASPQSQSHATRPLTALPPFLVALMLPPNYPLCASPCVTSLTCTHGWYSSSDLEMQLAGIGAEFIESRDIMIIKPSPSTLLPLLESYNTHTQDTAFAETSFPCAICLSARKGRDCIRLGCTHIFCHSCLLDFWGSCIRDGDIGRVGCPDPACVKTGHEAGEEDRKRWKWLREKRAFERDPGMVRCPVTSCQTAVPSPEEEDEIGWGRLRTCPRCEYVFCACCRRTWHGPIVECMTKCVTEPFVMEYMGLAKGDGRRVEIERWWGKKKVKRLILERKNREWISRNCTECPGCGVQVEKSVGCNHMTCIKCKQHFCNLCGEKLSALEPYKHFNTIGNKIYSIFKSEFKFNLVLIFFFVRRDTPSY
ncbi:hypothetical protein BDR07DRAFT_1447129 [Suillus spraguei]|nr:hypothetical protein BDR07DRAFT_1447129 [Suillus spraguei]